MSKKQIKISDIIIPKFYPLFNDIEHVHKIIDSGRAGTKSSYGAIHGIYKIISDDNCSIVVMRKFHNKLYKTVYKEFLRAIKRLGISKKKFKITKSPMQITYRKNGNTIYFTGNDSIDDTKGIIDENKPIKLVILDELTEFFERGQGEDEIANIEATFIRGNDEEFCMEYYFNPPKNPNAPIMQWVKNMEKRNDTIHIHVDYRDVPEKWLGKKLIESALEMLAIDERMYKWVWLGKCIGLDEIIYYMFDEVEHVLNRDLTEKEKSSLTSVIAAVDYGQMNATVFEFFGYSLSKQMIYGLDEFAHSGRDTGKQMTPSKYANEFKNMCLKIENEFNKKVRYVYIDPSAKGLAEEIKRVCPWVKIRNAENAVLLGISRTQKVLAFKKIIFSHRQENLLKEIPNYGYDKKSIEAGKEVPVKQDDHSMDALRYMIMGIWVKIRKFLPKNIGDIDEKDGGD
ncbi:PBSX family phage terminase large subunit [Thomasclavelia cocleata]|uniref:PBSX family phage terminase large subunit n=1 Tax=Thomasclavelia cocleata TaxID=69824 RepID=UPI00243206D4|nr:PBSX family phage terminase large subunit [Thomasclavelia cocleata]